MGLMDLSNRMIAELDSGLSREEIFKKHVKEDPDKAVKYAYCIASIPQSAMRKKYLVINALLSVLLVAYAVLTVVAELPINPQDPTLFIVLKTLIPLVFAYFAFRFHGGAYRLIGMWCVYDMLESLMLTGVSNISAALKLLVLFFVIVLAFFIARKVFPHLRVLGPKKDADGNFFL